MGNFNLLVLVICTIFLQSGFAHPRYLDEKSMQDAEHPNGYMVNRERRDTKDKSIDTIIEETVNKLNTTMYNDTLSQADRDAIVNKTRDDFINTLTNSNLSENEKLEASLTFFEQTMNIIGTYLKSAVTDLKKAGDSINSAEENLKRQRRENANDSNVSIDRKIDEAIDKLNVTMFDMKLSHVERDTIINKTISDFTDAVRASNLKEDEKLAASMRYIQRTIDISSVYLKEATKQMLHELKKGIDTPSLYQEQLTENLQS